jgi:hypothetical protein
MGRQVLLVEDPVVQVDLLRLDPWRAVHVVQDHAVDKQVGPERQRLLERREERREVGAAVAGIAHLPPARLRGVEEPLQHARVGVLLGHPPPFGERVAEHDHAPDAGTRLAPLGITEAERVVAELDREGSARGDRVHARDTRRAIALADGRVAQVRVEGLARALGVAVEQQPAAAVAQARRVGEADRGDAQKAQAALEQREDRDDGRGGQRHVRGQRAQAGVHGHVKSAR